MHNQRFQPPTEEAFVLASLKEFVKLWGSGSQASFQLECKDRQACLKFSTQLGSPADLHFVPPFPSHGFHERPQYPRHKGPAQRERDRARAAAHRANQQLLIEAGKPAAAATTNTELSDSVQHSQQNQVPASLAGSQSPPTAPAGGPPSPHQAAAAAASARNDFPCLICDFESNWENGLKVHMTKKHLKVEQIDGNATLDDSEEDDKYLETCHYWKTGRLGTVFQTFFDVNQIIDSSNLSEEIKQIEKAKVLEARKCAFGENFKHVPPWNQKR